MRTAGCAVGSWRAEYGGKRWRGNCVGTVDSASRSSLRSCESCRLSRRGRAGGATTSAGGASSLPFPLGTTAGGLPAVATSATGLIPTDTASRWTRREDRWLGLGLGVASNLGVRRSPRWPEDGVDLGSRSCLSGVGVRGSVCCWRCCSGVGCWS